MQLEDKVRILLVDDDEDDYLITKELLDESRDRRYELFWASSYEEGIQNIIRGDVDVVLLDNHLGAKTGIEFLRDMQSMDGTLPVIMLTGVGNYDVDVAAMQYGAMGYLEKGYLNFPVLDRAIRYALSQHKVMDELTHLSTTDELTGLKNRRGFTLLAEQQWKHVQRTGRELLLLMIDMDGLKEINDTFGHDEGDRALKDFTNILNYTFRDSDIIARFGGDEFAVMALEAAQGETEKIVQRLHLNIEQLNTIIRRQYRLSCSVGIARYDPKDTFSLDMLIARADEELYVEKRAKQAETEPNSQ